MSPKFGVWAHICGSDLVRDADGVVYVLEDNLRVPSGASYLLQNRAISKRAFADLFERQSILPVDDYPDQLRRLLVSLAADELQGVRHPQVVVLTPGVYNSAYFEHAFLAQQMGVPLVEGADLFVDTSDRVWMRTIDGPKPVDVIYRRIDDQFLDPEVFRKDSHLGVPGLMRPWRAGNVAIANAPGAGVGRRQGRLCMGARFHPLLPRRRAAAAQRADVPMPVRRRVRLRRRARRRARPEAGQRERRIRLDDRELGDTAEQLEAAIAAIKADPRNWVAQPILKLSTAPTLCDGELAPRHVDLRPFVLSGRDTYVTMGGLTRVALVDGSLVVNSSQGGGSKDTWVVEDS